MKVNSTVTINHMLLKQLEQAQIRALEMTTEQLHQEVDQEAVVPFDNGTLSGEAMFNDYSKSEEGRTSIVNSTAYARRLYFHPEYNFNQDNHVNAGGEWYEPWMRGGAYDKRPAEIFRKFFRQEAGL